MALDRRRNPICIRSHVTQNCRMLQTKKIALLLGAGEREWACVKAKATSPVAVSRRYFVKTKRTIHGHIVILLMLVNSENKKHLLIFFNRVDTMQGQRTLPIIVMLLSPE